MGVLTRVRWLVKANINEILAKAENPEKTLKQCIRDMEESLAEARQKVTEAIAGQKMLTRKAEKERSESEKWENRAILALRKDEEGLAREAVLRKRNHDVMVETLTAEEAKQSGSVEILRRTLAALEAKLDEAREKRDILLARKKTAKTREDLLRELDSVASHGGKVDTSAFEAFEEVEERIMDLEAGVEAKAEIRETLDRPGTGQPAAAEARFEEIERQDYVDRELERLREKARTEA